MTDYDVFNGDADGICALQQLRLAEPGESTPVTGVKRDIKLLARTPAGEGDRVTVLDISLDKNREALQAMLERGARVRYFDHHYAGEIPQHPLLEAHIDTTASIGTCFLVNRYLEGRCRSWAVVGSFGDNFDATARELAKPLGLREEQLGLLRELGVLMNYNAYGASVEDLHFSPEELYYSIRGYRDPLDFVVSDPAFGRLRDGYAEDMAEAESLRPEIETANIALYILPAEAWARRVGGVLANDLARAAPARAHAILTRLPDSGFVVSVRAPLEDPNGADRLCRLFPSGGGRKAAAGINRLEEDRYEDFVETFRKAFESEGGGNA